MRQPPEEKVSGSKTAGKRCTGYGVARGEVTCPRPVTKKRGNKGGRVLGDFYIEKAKCRYSSEKRKNHETSLDFESGGGGGKKNNGDPPYE